MVSRGRCYSMRRNGGHGGNTATPLAAQARRLVGGHLPLAVVFGVDLEGADAEGLLADHLYVDETREHGSFAVKCNFQIAEREGLVMRGAFRHGSDVLLFVLLLS